ncbi:GntR family transcriptional regulator [Bacillus songklensis]|uniref:GntR family transcriptional regulator n=1 Tax=Bacillus songklensis TaxID=1069116 RepID=A0ABV8B313_9BACI
MRIPLYKQIQKYIADNIQQKRWAVNSKIPSENELAEQFNVSRITIKKALDDLVEERIIYRIQGKGSFVASNMEGEPSLYETPSQTNHHRQKLIACITPRFNSELATATFSQIESTLAEQGYRMILCQTHDSQKTEEQILRDVLQMGVEGIIIYPVEGEAYNEEVLRLTLKDFPLVLIDRYFRGIEANSVCSDNFSGSYEAIRHLIELGHTRIGVVSTMHKGTTSIEDRIAGYEKALTDADIPIDHHLYLLNLQKSEENVEKREENKKEIQTFLQKNPEMTAIFAVTPGLEVLEAALEFALQVPDDLSIITFDDYSHSHLFSIPPSCVRQQGQKIGQEAAKLLISAIENPGQKRKKILIPTKLVVRQSTAACKVIPK